MAARSGDRSRPRAARGAAPAAGRRAGVARSAVAGRAPPALDGSGAGGIRVRIATLANAAVGHTRRWVEGLRGRGHTVGVWSLEPGPAELGAERLPAFPLPGFLRYPLAAPALMGVLARFGPDLVDAHYVPNYGL